MVPEQRRRLRDVDLTRLADDRPQLVSLLAAPGTGAQVGGTLGGQNTLDEIDQLRGSQMLHVAPSP